MKELLLIRGLSGSGKTRLAQLIEGICDDAAYGARVFTTDDYWTTPTGGYHFDPSRIARAHQWNQDRVLDAMINETEHTPLIIVPNTFSTNKELAPYLTLAKEYGYTVTVVTVESGLDSVDLAIRNTHNVPQEVIQRMIHRWEPYDAGYRKY